MSVSHSQALALLLLRRRKRKQRRRFGIHPINRLRDERGELRLLPQLRAHPERFSGYFRMSSELFDSLLNFVESSLVKLSARTPISQEHRLALTLRFLATGASFRHLAYSFRMGESTVRKIVVETCKAIWSALHDVYVRVPQTTGEWLNIADEFERRWNVPHCLGAIDGKHVSIVCPPNSGSLFYNYKGHYSVSLLAVCDARYRILYMDSGNYGKASDGGLFDSSDLKRAMDNGQLDLPDPAPLRTGGRVLPYFFVGDAAFPLSDRMMKPFPMTNGMDESRRLFNYRLCRARRVIENCFGLMAVKWRVLLTTIATRPETCDHIVQAVCALHNFVIDETPSGEAHPSAMADDDDDENGRWRSSGYIAPGEHPPSR